jgi:DNA-dependent RNA polymerase auxiliary subunit epsilon
MRTETKRRKLIEKGYDTEHLKTLSDEKINEIWENEKVKQ